MTLENGRAGNGAPDPDYVDDELERSHTERVDAVLRDFSDFSGRGAATTGAQLYDLARDADGPITVAELVDRWVAGAGAEQLGHARRYAEVRRRSGKRPRATPSTRSFSDVANARVWLRSTLGHMVRSGSLRRLDGDTSSRGLWAGLDEPGRPPRVNVGEPRRVGGTVKRQVGPYDEAERARREAEAERERARARIAGLEQPLGRADEADVLRLGALALGSLAELVEEAAGLDARGPGTRAGNLLRRFAPTGRRLELELVHEEVVRELLRHETRRRRPLRVRAHRLPRGRPHARARAAARRCDVSGVKRLRNGNLLVPARAESDDGGVIGGGMVDIGPDDPDYDEWVRELERQAATAPPQH